MTDDFLTSIAQAAEVKDIDKWNSDRESQKWASILSRNKRQATGFGFTGTPSILVEGPGGRKTFAAIPSVSQIEAAVKAVE